MSNVKTIFSNMSWLFVSQIIASVCGFIWTIVIARYLGVNDYGILGFAISLTGILAITMDLGVNSHVVREIATNYDLTPKYLGNAIPLKSLFVIGTFILTLIILILMKANQLTITITLLFTIEMVFKTFIGLLNGSFQAYEEGKYQGIGNILLNIILLIFILISIFTDLGIFGITLSYVVANFIPLVYEYVIFTKKFAKPKFEFDIDFCRTITMLALPFALSGIFYSIYYSVDTVMLSNMIGDYATGIYNASYKLISVLTVFYSVYTAVIYPVMSKFFKNDEKLLVVVFEKSVKYLSLVIIPIAIATVLYSTDIVQLIFGIEFNESSSALSILIWTVCLLFINGACGTLLNASHKEMTVTKVYFIAAVFNIVLNLFMIPHYSYVGAAISTVLSDLLILIISLYVIYKLGYRVKRKLYVDLIKIIIGSSIMGGVLYLLNLNMWVALPIGIIIYFGVLILLKLFDDDDKYVIKEVIGKS